MNPLPLVLALCVQAEIVRLGDDSFKTREQASQALQTWTPYATQQVRQACKSGDPEVARRAEVLLEAFAREHAEFFRARAKSLRCAGFKLVPWIDSLPADYPDRHQIVLNYVTQAKDQQEIAIDLVHRFDEYRVATILFTIDLLKAGVSEEEILSLYSKMARQEVEWLKRQGAVWGEVLTEATAKD
jgi:hypothetical protein